MNGSPSGGSSIGVAKWKKGAWRAENMDARPSRLEPVKRVLIRSLRLSRLVRNAAIKEAFPWLRASSCTSSKRRIVGRRLRAARSMRSSR